MEIQRIFRIIPPLHMKNPVEHDSCYQLESGTAQKTNKKNNQSVVSERPADHNAKRRTGSVNRKPWAMTEPSVQKLSFL